jgi:para-nitrobenzyl esterase
VIEPWIHFARTGNPNHSGIPRWAEFAPDSVPKMIFDSKTEAVNNPGGGEQASIAEA